MFTACLEDVGAAFSDVMSKLTGKDAAKAEEAPLTPEDIAGVLRDRGWEAEVVPASATPDMVDVQPTGILKCVDGRGSDNNKMAGPKITGGVYAIAHNRGVTTTDGLAAITKEVAAAGHVPSVHGDDGAKMLGCGFLKLWITGRFDDMGYPRPDFDADQGAAAVKGAGGVIEMHHGSHAEKVVLINLVEGKTLEPIEDDQRFIVDGWAAGKFSLDVPKFLVAAAATVEMLGGPKKAKIIVP